MNLKNQFLTFILLFCISSCTTEKKPTINYLEKNASPDYYDMPYKSGNWEHPKYTNTFKFFGNPSGGN